MIARGQLIHLRKFDVFFRLAVERKVSRAKFEIHFNVVFPNDPMRPDQRRLYGLNQSIERTGVFIFKRSARVFFSLNASSPVRQAFKDFE